MFKQKIRQEEVGSDFSCEIFVRIFSKGEHMTNIEIKKFNFFLSREIDI